MAEKQAIETHTPGPWGYVLDGTARQIWTGDGIRLLAYVQPYGTPSEDEANARLIAAAPSLKDELIGYMQRYGCDCTEPSEPPFICSTHRLLQGIEGGVDVRL